MTQDLILNQTHCPEFSEIGEYMDDTGRMLLKAFDDFSLSRFKATRKTVYSKCSGKPGWNVKYQRSGKSLCTLYPEKNGFVVLVVVLLEMIPAIHALKGELSENLLQLVDSASPFNGTKWLMIPVYEEAGLAGVKTLLLLKHEAKTGGIK